MILRARTLLSVGGVLFGLILVLYLASRFVMLSAITRQEELSTHDDMQSFLDVFANEENEIKQDTVEWGQWDDTYQFIENGNPAYITSNLTAKSFRNLKLNLIAYVNRDGRIIYHTARNNSQSLELPFPQSVLNHLDPEDALFKGVNEQNNLRSGVLALPEGIYIVSIGAILKNDASGPERGWLFLGRVIDSVEISQISNAMHLDLAIQPVGKQDLPANIQTQLFSDISAKEKILVQTISNQRMIAYARIDDIYNQPALVITLNANRDIYHIGQVNLLYNALTYFLLGSVALLAMLWLLERFILSRLARLNHEIESIGLQGDSSRRISIEGKDELSDLATSINSTLEKLEQSQITMLKREELNHRRAEELSVLHAVAVSGTEIDSEDALIEKATQIIGENLYPDMFGVLLVDQATQTLIPHESYRGVDQAQRNIRILLGKGITGRVAQTGNPWLINDVSQTPEYIQPGEIVIHSELVVPLKIKDQVIGVFNAESSHLNAYTDADLHLMVTLAGQVATGVDRLRRVASERLRARQLETIYQVSQEMISASLEPETVYTAIHNAVGKLMPAEAFVISLFDEAGQEVEAVYRVDRGGRYPVLRIPASKGLSGKIISTGQPMLVSDIDLEKSLDALHFGGPNHIRSFIAVPMLILDRTIGMLSTQSYEPRAYSEEDLHLLELLGAYAAIALENARLYRRTRLNAERMSMVGAIGRKLTETLDLPEIYSRVVFAVHTLLPEMLAVYLALCSPDREKINYAFGIRHGDTVRENDLNQLTESEIDTHYHQEVIRSGRPLITAWPEQENAHPLANLMLGGSESQGFSTLYVPMVVKGETVGLIQVIHDGGPRFDLADIDLLTLVGNTAAIAIENARLFAETEQRLRRLAALRAMDMAISSSFDLRVTLNVLLDQVTAELGVDAASVLLFNSYTQTLDYSAGRGFRGSAITTTHLRLDDELAGRAALERRLVSVDLHFEQYARKIQTGRSSFNRIMGEDFIIYYGMPLIAKGQVKGVLEIFNRTALNPNPEWLEFLETLAGDTAIAIDNTGLFNDLQRSNIEMVLAYDTTLEGWSHVLELRDQETEGHTRRVAELTMQLGARLGINPAELVHLRRGALLHDIGKMGVPDNILRKPGPLTPDEWEVMRMHPVYAYNMLLPIPYLHQALDIPYCHHEKWNGTGYPRHLKGTEIPLGARIFAVVDVWDALRSDRPYRKAGTDREALDYIRSQSGEHFDPEVVDVFLKLLGEKL